MISAGPTLCFHCVKRKSFTMVSSARSIVFYSSSKTVGKLVPRRQTQSQSFFIVALRNLFLLELIHFWCIILVRQAGVKQERIDL